MRALHTFAIVGVLGGVLGAALSGCSSTDPGTPANSGGAAGKPGTAGSGGTATAAGGAGGGATLVGDATRGATLWVSPALGCNICHGAHAEGAAAPNITKSVTAGIGAYTLAQFRLAVREAKNKEGQPLCFTMSAFGADVASEQAIADLYAFQQAQPAVDTLANATYCTPGCCTGEHK